MQREYTAGVNHSYHLVLNLLKIVTKAQRELCGVLI